jgi:membrane-associated phospholipid phosphatase
LLLLLLAADPSWAEERGTPEEGSDDPTALLEDRFPHEWDAALKRVGDDFLYLLTAPLRLTGEEMVMVAGIGAGIGGLLLADSSIHDELRRPKKDEVRDVASWATLLGSAPLLLGLNLAGVTAAEVYRQSGGSSKHLKTALTATEAQLFALAFSESLAFMTARSRPAGGADPLRFEFGRTSFPSSHTAQAFAVAAVLADQYDQPVPLIAYGMAGMVGLSRLVLDKHWTSDVAAGAVLGWAIGKSLSRRHSTQHGSLDFFPFTDPVSKQYGVMFRKAF